MFGNFPQTGVAELRRPQVEILERGELDNDVRTVARHVREPEIQALQISERADAENLTQVLVRALFEAQPQGTFLLLLHRTKRRRKLRSLTW